MFTISSANGKGSRPGGSARRWKNKSITSSNPPSTPFRERTNTMKTDTATPTNNTTFLPEFNSTPPMPAFDGSPAIPLSRIARGGGAENVTPARAYGTGRRPDSDALPTIIDTYHAVKSPASARLGVGCGSLLVDRLEETPPFPDGWSSQHDRAICVLDARNYSIPTIVARIRRTFPRLQGVLTTAMVDKRLRQLDQDIEIDYWRVGLHGTKNALNGPTVRVDSGSVLVEDTVHRRPEPPPKDTVSGSLMTSPSAVNLLPDAFSLSTESSRVNVISPLATSSRTTTRRRV